MMISTSEWIAAGLLRATLGLSAAALLVAACVRLLRPRAPRAEQWAWFFVLVQGVVLLPISIPIASPEASAKPRPQATKNPAPFEIPETPPQPERASPPGTTALTESDPHGRVPDVASMQGNASGASRRSWSFAGYAPVVVVSGWGVGVLMLVGIASVRYRTFAARVRAACPAPSEWQDQWRRALDEGSITTPIPLLVSQGEGPALCRVSGGYRLVVPGELWAGLAEVERAAILRHELAHFRRGDLWSALAARALAVFQWFNPLAWRALACFEAQAEFLCDRASAGDDPAGFAGTLLRLGTGGHDRVAAVRAARAGDLFERIQRLLVDAPRPALWKRATPVILAVVALTGASVKLRAVAAPDGPDAARGGTNAPRGNPPALTEKPLLHVGTDDLRTRDFVTSLTFSPDGTLIAASAANGPLPKVELFDVRTGRIVKGLIPPDRPAGWVKAIAYSPNGKRLAWGEIDGHVTLWDLAHDRMLLREKLHKAGVSDVEFSPDGTLLVSAGEDGVVRFRDVAKPGEVLRDIVVGEHKPTGDMMGGFGGGAGFGELCLGFTPDGSRLVVGSGASGTISAWRVADGALVRRLAPKGISKGGGSPLVQSVSVTPDGRRVISVGQYTVPISETKLKYGAKNVNMVRIQAWDLATGESLRTLNGEDEHGFGYAALSADGKRLAVGDFSALRILDAESGRVEREIPLPGSWGRTPAFSPDGTIVAMAIENTVALFETETGRQLLHDARTPVGGVKSAAWSPKGDRIVTGHEDGEVRVWEVSTGKLLWHQLLAPVISPSGWFAGPAFVAFSQDGRRVVVAGRRDDPVEYRNGIVAIYEANTGRPVRRVFHDEVRLAALSPDRTVLVVASSNGSIHDTHLSGIDVESGRTLYNTPPKGKQGGFWSVEAMAFRPGSLVLDVALGNSEVHRVDALTGKDERRFVADWRTPEQKQANRPDWAQLWEGSFSPDGRTLVSSSDEFVYVWDVETGALRRKIRHPHDHGCILTVAPDGRTVATADLNYAGDPGEDTIRLFNIETGEIVLTIDPGDRRASVLTFSPDGSKLLAGFYRGSTLVWDVSRATGPSRGKP